jgi:phospholipase C
MRFTLVLLLTAALLLCVACAAEIHHHEEGGTSDGPNIKHFVVLMLENRAFDHMLGFLRSDIPGLRGLYGNETNLVDPSQVCV